MHTEDTLAQLDAAAKAVGRSMNIFVNRMCAVIDTKELPKEKRTRERREQERAEREGKVPPAARTLKKPFKLDWYKFHPPLDYAPTIRWLSTADNWSTRTVRSANFIHNSIH
jgi:hypothetical protein